MPDPETHAADGRAAGEVQHGSQAERDCFVAGGLKLLSGKRFKMKRDDECYHATVSSDEGKTWQRQGNMVSRLGPLTNMGCLEGVAIQIQNGTHQGRIAVPFYAEMDGEHADYTREMKGGYAIFRGKRILLQTHTHVPEMGGTFVMFSDDEGATWTQSKGFLMGYFRDGYMGHMTADEPTIAELKDGRLLCFMRGTGGCILKSYSSDGGEYWTKVETTDLANSNSPAFVARVPTNGDLVCVWNQMSVDEIQRGFRRGRLSIAISQDDGQTWSHFKNLEVSEGIDPTITRVKAPELTAMVRGPQEMDAVPDGFLHFGYPEVYFTSDEICVFYHATSPAHTERVPPRWRVFPIFGLYQD